MELIGKLKDEMAQAKSKDEAKEIMENAGMKLNDDELDSVAGGFGICKPRKAEWTSPRICGQALGKGNKVIESPNTSCAVRY